jgi:hypothetical protein
MPVTTAYAIAATDSHTRPVTLPVSAEAATPKANVVPPTVRGNVIGVNSTDLGSAARTTGTATGSAATAGAPGGDSAAGRAAGGGGAGSASGATPPVPRISGTAARISAMPPVAVRAAVLMPSSSSSGSPTQMASSTTTATLTTRPSARRNCWAWLNGRTIGRYDESAATGL